MAYTKLEDLNFKDEESKELAKRLYKDIQQLEYQLMGNEELLESLKKSIGEQQANFVMGLMVGHDRRLLAGLKVAFYYYTGTFPGRVISDVDAEEVVDIFNPQ